MRLKNLSNSPYGIPLTSDPLWLPAMGETAEFNPDLLPDILKDPYVSGLVDGGVVLIIKGPGPEPIHEPAPTPAPDPIPPTPSASEGLPVTEEVIPEPAAPEVPAPVEVIPTEAVIPSNPWDAPAPAPVAAPKKTTKVAKAVATAKV